MKKPILEIRNIGKQYRIGSPLNGHHNFRELLLGGFRRLNPAWGRGAKSSDRNKFWALRNVSFDVHPGETIGIVGRNGAGKSTLLKILSKITTPTEGQVTARGRVASLLEVGTGFHTELTGRENIFLNGSILGLTKSEIERKFDEIVAFSGVEPFLDTQLKHYSSGMQLRLAFAVAAHLEPEILVIDEVLAVGDAEFQKKCLGKMGEVSRSGRTVLFVSHNLGAVRQLCRRCILLDQGTLITEGNTEKVIQTYLSSPNRKSYYKLEGTPQTTEAHVLSARLESPNGLDNNEFDFNQAVVCRLDLQLARKIKGLHFGISLVNKNKSRVFFNNTPLENFEGEVPLKITLPSSIFAPGHYSLSLMLHIPNQVMYDDVQDVMPFEIIDPGTELSRYSVFTGDIIVNPDIEIGLNGHKQVLVKRPIHKNL